MERQETCAAWRAADLIKVRLRKPKSRPTKPKNKRMKQMEHARSESQPFAGSDSPIKEIRRSGAGGSGSSVSESMARSKEAIGTAATEAMNSGASDLQSLRADLNSLKDTVTTFMSKAGNEAAKSAREVTSTVAAQVSGVASDLAGKGAEVASAATEQAKTFASELESMARRNPIGALAGAVLIGVLIGLMGRRS
jgi:ElaB/YqjD/DUF883 family membrane-anchored ribosome-binding protein